MGTDYDVMVSKATALLQTKHGASFVTVQVEPYRPEVMSECEECIGPAVC